MYRVRIVKPGGKVKPQRSFKTSNAAKKSADRIAGEKGCRTQVERITTEGTEIIYDSKDVESE